MRLSLISILLLLSQSSFAAGEGSVGNGGIGYRCGAKIVLLDALEAKERNFHLDVPESLKTVRELVTYWLNRLALKDNRGIRFQTLADQMLSDIEIAQGNEYYGKVILFSKKPNQPTWDSHERFEVIGYEGCTEKVQIVRRDNIVRPEDRLFRIDLGLWNQMSFIEQALTVTHELFYYEKPSETDSTNARYLNEAVTSMEFEKMSDCDWSERLRKTGLRAFGYGISEHVYPSSCYPNGRVKEAEISNLGIDLTSPIQKGLTFGTNRVTFSEDDTSIIAGNIIGHRDGQNPLLGPGGYGKGDQRVGGLSFTKTSSGYHLTGKLSQFRRQCPGSLSTQKYARILRHIGLVEYDVSLNGNVVQSKVTPSEFTDSED